MLSTGGSSGIGRAIALAVARAGANVGITYRANHDGAEDVVREVDALGRQAAAFPLQLSDVNAIEECGAAFLERFNRLDVWINNAGADVLTGAAAKVSEADKLDVFHHNPAKVVPRLATR